MKTTVIIRPVISEKSVHLGSANKYTFVVDKRTNASTIKAAIKELFKVKVKNVQIINVKGKPKHAGRTKVMRASWKKAIVTLQAGQTIKLFEEQTSKDAS